MNVDLTVDQLDALFNEARPHREIVPLCINGEVLGDYEDVQDRIAGREQKRHAAQKAAQMAEAFADDRLAGGPAVDDPGDDLEDDVRDRAEAARLLQLVHKFTIPFRVEAMPPEDFDELFAAHPPRTDQRTGQRDPRDQDGVNVQTFYSALLRRCLTYPKLDDDRYARAIAKLRVSQRERLHQAAANVNTMDGEVPFWPVGSDAPSV